jgi:iron complex transport system substrate-binding protein
LLDRDPMRIIPLAPSLTELLYFLGLEERVVGVTDFSYYPAAAMEKPRVGSYINLNVEKIIDLAPNLVIGTKDGNEPGTVALLEQAGIPVYIVNPRSVESVISTIAEIGGICGIPEKAGAMVRDMTRRFESVRAAIRNQRKPLVFLQINLVPIMTVNKNTLHHDLIRLAGGVNMTSEEPITYPRISVEEVIRKQPEVIIISSMERGGQFEQAKKDWMQWTSIPAVKGKRVSLIDSDLIDRSSPRIIDGLEAMARIIHPEVNWEK